MQERNRGQLLEWWFALNRNLGQVIHSVTQTQSPSTLPHYSWWVEWWNKGSFFSHPTAACHQWSQTSLLCLLAHLPHPWSFINLPGQKASSPSPGEKKHPRIKDKLPVVHCLFTRAICAGCPLQRLLVFGPVEDAGPVHIVSLGWILRKARYNGLGIRPGKDIPFQNNLHQDPFGLICIWFKMQVPQED